MFQDNEKAPAYRRRPLNSMNNFKQSFIFLNIFNVDSFIVLKN